MYEAISNNFKKIESILAENFSDDSNMIKTEMLDNIMSLHQHQKSRSVIIDNQNKIKNIMQICRDDKCKTILQKIITPKTVDEISDATGISHAIIYRKISSMRKENMVKLNGFKITSNGKIPQYAACFEDIQIMINKTTTVAYMF